MRTRDLSVSPICGGRGPDELWGQYCGFISPNALPPPRHTRILGDAAVGIDAFADGLPVSWFQLGYFDSFLRPLGELDDRSVELCVCYLTVVIVVDHGTPQRE